MTIGVCNWTEGSYTHNDGMKMLRSWFENALCLLAFECNRSQSHSGCVRDDEKNTSTSMAIRWRIASLHRRAV